MSDQVVSPPAFVEAIENTKIMQPHEVATPGQVTEQVTLTPVPAPSRARTRGVARPPTSRSAVTNDPRRLHGVNAGSAQGRRFRDLVEALERELGEDLGEAERLLIRNAASLQLHVEDLTSRLARGEPIEPAAFTRAANAAARAISALRRRKPAKARGPGVVDYLKAKQGAGA
jgi:hypothetical protein